MNGNYPKTLEKKSWDFLIKIKSELLITVEFLITGVMHFERGFAPNLGGKRVLGLKAVLNFE